MNGLADEVKHYGTTCLNPNWFRDSLSPEIPAGLQLARLADLPKDVLTQAGEITRCLSSESTRKHESSESCKVARRRKVVLKVPCGSSPLNSLNFYYDLPHRKLPAANDVDTSL